MKYQGNVLEKKSLIDQIFNEYFATPANVIEGYKNALVKISCDIYEKDTHFIYEIIQNAEDNFYKTIEPEITFSLNLINGLEWLLIFNNETGFEEANVKAICSVGKTTKTDRSKGYIGQKGIGFKSVFLVTDKPYIYSNQFSFCLPERIDGLDFGYIAPVWCEPSELPVDRKVTNIFLPLKENVVEHIFSSLKAFKAETLLFLSKLIKIGIDLYNKHTIKIEKIVDGKLNTLLVKEDKQVVSSQTFFVFSKNIEVPENSRDDERKGFDSTRISICIQLSGSQEPPQKVFAYLPVWEDATGLPFIINADFLLTTSRESIHQDKMWNTNIRDNIAKVYVDALIECLKDPNTTTDETIMLLKSLPVKSNRSFLSPVVDEIQEKLKLKAFLPVLGNKLACPKSVRIVKNIDFFHLFHIEGKLPDFLNQDIYVLLPELNIFEEILVKYYGVKLISDKEILNLLNDFDWIKERSI